MPEWTPRRWTEVFGEQAASFRAAVAQADLAAPVPSCPGWTFTELTVHVARFLAQVTRYLSSGSTVQLRPVAPAPVLDPLGHLDDELAQATVALGAAPGNRPVWTFSPAAPDLARVWHRRAAHELNLRRWDAQAALRTLDPTDPDQATDAIDELLGTLLAARQLLDAPPSNTGTAVVSTTDRPHAWFVRLLPGQAPEVRAANPDEPADAYLTGKAANLLYQLWGRMQLTGSGDERVLRALRMS
ncbi:maleylpyruvate isomerase N-terminal domain-containing protein [Actinophytocola gossypii]|uniref:Maleylpyruvate isomerase N-terminal domain-containing protein n=1 Tax=Actinophytocola gossypii TaxID=2812003 RepID=A0ABT2JEU0_9PSEU|nr:maleylpyruvate isomerase N-terminal domain-containing protein [Actinophytocola gossypii]MCT2585955.1 maleylpyruvate isomerase N-terminal domain-containing protein [Actinophytocola gossypii]